MKKSHSKTMTQEKSSELGPGNMKRKPWKVYQRDNTEVSFRLTERDIEILKFIYKFRCVNTEQIHALFGGSKQVVWRRLKYLFQGGYIDRIRARQVKDYNAPMIYGLGNRGADYLSETLGVLMPKSDWTTKTEP